jgi:hypothetical protein
MTDELKKIIFSPRISYIFNSYNWIINIDSKNKFHCYFVGEIADYYLKIYNDKDKIYFQFTLDIEIPKNMTNELLMLINIANQNLKEGFFVFDFKLWKIKYNLVSPYYLRIEEKSLHDFLKIKLDLTKSLFHNFVSGIHNLVYGEKIKSASLELLFLNYEGSA